MRIWNTFEENYSFLFMICREEEKMVLTLQYGSSFRFYDYLMNNSDFVILLLQILPFFKDDGKFRFKSHIFKKFSTNTWKLDEPTKIHWIENLHKKRFYGKKLIFSTVRRVKYTILKTENGLFLPDTN